jgi:hypothetical protein
MAPTVLLVLVLAVVVVLLLVWAVARRDRVDETERFHRASQITSSWASPSAPATPQAAPSPAPQAAPSPAPDAGPDESA